MLIDLQWGECGTRFRICCHFWDMINRLQGQTRLVYAKIHPLLYTTIECLAIGRKLPIANCQLLVKISQKCKYISSTRSTSFNYSTILARRTIVGSWLEMYLYGKFIQSSLVAAIDDWHSALGISINHHTPTKPAIPSKATHSKHIRFECRPVSFPAAHFKFPTRADRKRAYLMDGHSSLFAGMSMPRRSAKHLERIEIN